MWSNVFDTDDSTNGQSMRAYMMAVEGHFNFSLSLPPPPSLSLFLSPSPSLSLLLHAHTEQAVWCLHAYPHVHSKTTPSSIGNPQCIGECEASLGTYFALLNNIWICVLEGLILQVVRIPLFVCACTVSLELNSDAY